MQRFYATQILGLVVMLVGSCATFAYDWPLGRGDERGTAASKTELPEKLEMLWQLELGGIGFESTPIIADKHRIHRRP